MIRIHSLLAGIALSVIVGCGGTVIDNTNDTGGKPTDIAPVVNTPNTPSSTRDASSTNDAAPSTTVEAPKPADVPPPVAPPLNAPEQSPKAVEAVPAANNTPPAAVVEGDNPREQSSDSVLSSIGKALRRGLIAAPDENAKE